MDNFNIFWINSAIDSFCNQQSSNILKHFFLVEWVIKKDFMLHY